jgi:predicted nuclease of predicted toxin-antitoxin system
MAPAAVGVSAVRLLLDEHFSFRIAEQLRRRGFDVLAVAERADLRQMSDQDLLRCAHRDERAVVTENVQDFLPIHGEFLNHGEPHSGIVLTSPHKFSRSTAGIGTLVTALARLLEQRGNERALQSDVLWL